MLIEAPGVLMFGKIDRVAIGSNAHARKEGKIDGRRQVVRGTSLSRTARRDLEKVSDLQAGEPLTVVIGKKGMGF